MSDAKGDKLNLDLIQMVQNARMKHDADAVPSKVPGVYWIEAKRQSGDYPDLTSRAGEWQIPTTVAEVDDLWSQIKAATEAGQLGYKSKVSTAPAQHQGNRDERLICVRTYAADDTADVKRVQQQLEAMGITAAVYRRDEP